MQDKSYALVFIYFFMYSFNDTDNSLYKLRNVVECQQRNAGFVQTKHNNMI